MDQMSSAKEEVSTLLARLPEDCTIEDIQYRLYMIEKFRKGLEAADSGQFLSQEQAEARLNKWLVQ